MMHNTMWYMRAEYCRKCGNDMQKYDKCNTCSVCNESIMQSFCPNCRIVTDPQHHKHGSTAYAAVICGLLNLSYIAQEANLAAL